MCSIYCTQKLLLLYRLKYCPDKQHYLHTVLAIYTFHFQSGFDDVSISYDEERECKVHVARPHRVSPALGERKRSKTSKNSTKVEKCCKISAVPIRVTMTYIVESLTCGLPHFIAMEEQSSHWHTHQQAQSTMVIN